MLKKEVSYIDYDGNRRQETLYFNMNKAEIAAMQVKMDGKYIGHLKDLVANNKIESLFDFFRGLVLDSYGKKSEDGRRFVKNAQLREEFEQSIPFSDILIDLLTDGDKMSNFTRNILPPDLITEAGGLDAQAIPPIS